MYAYKEGSSSSVVPVVKISDISTKATLPMNYELEVRGKDNVSN